MHRLPALPAAPKAYAAAAPLPQVPRFWLIGYDENRQPLTSERVRLLCIRVCAWGFGGGADYQRAAGPRTASPAGAAESALPADAWGRRTQDARWAACTLRHGTCCRLPALRACLRGTQRATLWRHVLSPEPDAGGGLGRSGAAPDGRPSPS